MEKEFNLESFIIKLKQIIVKNLTDFRKNGGNRFESAPADDAFTTTRFRPINRLVLHGRGFLKGCKNIDEKYLYCSSFFCSLTLHAGTGGIHRFLGCLIMLLFQSRISN